MLHSPQGGGGGGMDAWHCKTNMCNIKLFVQYILEIKILFEPFIVPPTIL